MTKQQISIGMNGSMLDEHPTGVGVYSFNLINNLTYLYQNEQERAFTVFSPTQSLLHKNLRVIKLPDLLLSSKYGKTAALCRFLWNTFSYPLQARRFDLLISPTTHGSFLLRNQIITIHDLLSLRYKNISAHQRFYFKYLLPFLISRAKLIIAVSETTKKEIIHYLKCPPEKIKVIYNGYDDNRYHVIEGKTHFIRQQYGVSNYLLAVGPTYPHKNFEALIDAYYMLHDAIKARHPLVIAGGKKGYVNQLREYVHKLKLNDHVHFVGYVPMALMASLYREALALVFPSLYEGFGFPLLEAMACGCPVVTGDVSSMPEVCEKAALYFNPLDTCSIATAMEKIISDEGLRQALKEKGLVQVRKFSWEQTAKTFKTLIDNQFPLIKPPHYDRN